MGLGEHLDELRRRLVFAILGLLPIFGLGMYFGKEILQFLIAPVIAALHAGGQSGTMQATGLLETFGSYMKVAAVMTLIVGGPWMIFQLWKFVAPGLYTHERRFAYVLAPMSLVLSVSGAAFAYYIMLPVMLKFLIAFGGSVGLTAIPTTKVDPGVPLPAIVVLHGDPPNPKPGEFWINSERNEWRVCVGMKDQITAADGTLSGGTPKVLGTHLTSGALIDQVPRVGETVDLLMLMAVSFAGAFQTPVVVLLLGWAGIVKPATLKKHRRYVIATCTILAAILSPSPDPVSFLLLLGPMYGLYELGVFLLILLPASKVSGRKRQPEEQMPGGPADGP